MPADIVAEIMCRYACYGFKINVWELEKRKALIIYCGYSVIKRHREKRQFVVSCHSPDLIGQRLTEDLT